MSRSVPFFKPQLSEAEIAEVVATLRSGWLTTGPRTKRFEQEFAAFAGSKHAVAVNSCTAALHLALEAIGLGRGDLVLVPTMTFAATAEVVRYFDAIPVLVDCDPRTLCIDVAAARATATRLVAGQAVPGLPEPRGKLRAIIPMHYGGQMADVDGVAALAAEFGLTVIEDAAHSLPAAFRSGPDAPWRKVGTTAPITCFSFYANKCITTGEGGMAVTDDDAIAERMRVMCLHGMSKDAWKRFSSDGSWYYEIVAPGFKYNLTDIASAIGLGQLARAHELHAARTAIAEAYGRALGGIPGVETPWVSPDRQHAWHLFPIRVPAAQRNGIIEALKARGIGTSVHYMPLHLHPYYRKTYGTGEGDFPVAEAVWPRLVSLPLYPGMNDSDVQYVASALRECVRVAPDAGR